jgi:hypothetical protein
MAINRISVRDMAALEQQMPAEALREFEADLHQNVYIEIVSFFVVRWNWEPQPDIKGCD